MEEECVPPLHAPDPQMEEDDLDFLAMVKNIPILDLGDVPPQRALELDIEEVATALRAQPTLPPG
eukprot:1105702-Prorocentrum_lima.AAC.1